MEYKSKYKKVGVLLIRIVNSNISSIGLRQRKTGIWNTFLDVGMLVCKFFRLESYTTPKHYW